MLGSVSEADDAVQEAWLRLSRNGASGVENLEGWLTTVVARVCLDMLRARKARREEPLGPHVPEPVVSGAGGSDPEREALVYISDEDDRFFHAAGHAGGGSRRAVAPDSAACRGYDPCPVCCKHKQPRSRA